MSKGYLYQRVSKSSKLSVISRNSFPLS